MPKVRCQAQSFQNVLPCDATRCHVSIQSPCTQVGRGAHAGQTDNAAHAGQTDSAAACRAQGCVSSGLVCRPRASRSCIPLNLWAFPCASGQVSNPFFARCTALDILWALQVHICCKARDPRLNPNPHLVTNPKPKPNRVISGP